MKDRYTLEITFVILVVALALAGFSGLYLGPKSQASPLHHLHVATSLGWLGLLLAQLLVLRRRAFNRHRMIGLSIFIAGPLLIATLALLSVHSAARDAAIGRADAMLVMNVMGTVNMALLILLAFLLRRRREVHGAMLLGTALSFMGTAVFFTLLNVVPAYRIEGPETFHRFAEAGQAAGLAVAVVALLFFVRGPRAGWPWLLTGALFLGNGVLQGILAANQSTLALTRVVATIDPTVAFVGSLFGFAALLWLAWKWPQRGRAAMPLKRGEQPATAPVR